MYYNFALLSYLAYQTISQKNILIVLNDNFEAKTFYESLIFFKEYYKKDVYINFFEAYSIGAHSSIAPSSQTIRMRLKTLAELKSKDRNHFLVASQEALMQPTIKEESFLLNSIERNQSLNRKEFIELLVNLYYDPTSNVEDIGQYCIRGSLVDCFVPIYEKPLRIDFFGDTIDDIRMFYCYNQRTHSKIDKACITYAKEYNFAEDEYGFSLIGENIRGYLLDYKKVKELTKYCYFDERTSELSFKRTKSDDSIYDLRILKEKTIDYMNFINEFETIFASNIPTPQKLDFLIELSRSMKVVIACASDFRVDKLKNILQSKGARIVTDDEYGIYLSNGYLKKGFRTSKIAFVSFEEIFGVAVQKDQELSPKMHLVQFQKDKLIAHKNYGIGIYRGIKTLKVEDALMDFFEIEYANQDKVYVPVTNADCLFEYSGTAQIDSLNSKSWHIKKENAQKAIKKILTELVNVYAKRKILTRAPYDTDLIEIKEFEAEFEYQETQDQLQAIEDVKNDMRSNTPMERLICGDVSFGKTEVAMRACAIACFNSRQCIVISPTTILSMQHYSTFTDRFANFPVKIALLNSFTKKSDREKIKSGLEDGSIDILISTHSVYFADINFKNLGLVIIDEEQHFGVKIKEHFKQKYETVDMLYLSATPIPRTLNMAINSIFGISVIKTPPLSRKRIQTYVIKQTDKIIKEAIERELSRDGSVFFVHNRIETIYEVKDSLDKLVPEYEKHIIHSKLPKNEIKKIITDFANRKFPILISTSIIESGLDLKHVNTIIISQAQNFGLSDLYQLRGRVGRSDIEAFAYLLYDGPLSEQASMRLTTLKEYMERGVGFNIALKDLEIRGAGNVFGKDQSGNLKAIGHDLYVELIQEALSQISNENLEREVEIKFIDNMYIPDWYIDNEKTAIYTLISKAKSEEELNDIKTYIEDRYGKIPKIVLRLIEISIIKLYAKKAFVKSLIFGKKGVSVQFYIDAKIDTDKLIKQVNILKGKFLSETMVFLNIDKDNLNVLKKFLINIV
ncbi:transcription-repair coupling factor (superfamily II helicase) [Desulfurella multipotens]|uniref:Transcription-repair-coupling factor n=1 Tax=Desulfurella multipotens TaxID=79269 RepID=A0A1G6JM52_9BACT|nr:helicase-related protein [Desulfurella multipotens]SDC19738.1 transcription-repair coupling factor (superfamily II helicase) [Desulfurella multipotens]